MKRLYYVRCFVLAESEQEAKACAMNYAGARNLEADKATAMHVLDENAGGTLPVQHPASDNKQTCGELVGLANWLPPKEP